MKVPYSYYEDEVRDGFYIHGMMKRAWAASIEVLEEIDRICKKYGITYFADAGTLLGAVRHKGFIPWDDDLDICMRREEYDRFISIAPKELESSKWFHLINIHTEPEYDEIFSRIVSGKKIDFSKGYLDKFHGFPFAVGVDIFPLDYLSESASEEELRCELVRIVDGAIVNIDEINERDSAADDRQEILEKNAVIDSMLASIEEVCKTRIDRTGNVKNQLYLLEEKLITLYNDENSSELALMPVWIKKKGNKFKKEYYQYTTELLFENIKIPVPAMYDAILKEKYGKYMKLVHNWDYHNYPFYKDQIEFLEEKTNIRFPKYEFNVSDLNKERIYDKNSDGDRYIKSLVKNISKLLREAHEEIAAHSHSVDIMLDILAECQNTAISMGNAIEEVKGEEFAAISIIETYCEEVYAVYEKVSICGEMMSDEGITVDNLNEVVEKIEKSVYEEIKTRREVVFLPYKASSWDYMESIWKAAMKDEECDVYVIPVPYYYKNPDLSIREEKYEGQNFPDYVKITNYRDYDIEKRQPDIIFIQNPFDEFNYTLSVLSRYYASHLKHYTDLLVYIPDFKLDEIDSRDKRAYASTQFFVTMPGVVQSDKVIVQSEEMKKTYVDVLTEFAGEETKKIWEEKIGGCGSPIDDVKTGNHEGDVQIPDKWAQILLKEDGRKKKVILYSTSASRMLEYGMKYLEKLRDVLTMFKNNADDIALIWQPYPGIREAVEYVHPELWAAYKHMTEEYMAGGWGIFDEPPAVDKAIGLCDAYYGDAGSLVQLCRNRGIPVMLQDVRVKEWNGRVNPV